MAELLIKDYRYENLFYSITEYSDYDWDSTDIKSIIIHYGQNVKGNSPISILGGNMDLLIQLIADVNYMGQIAFGFSSNKIVYRNRQGGSPWSEWKIIA